MKLLLIVRGASLLALSALAGCGEASDKGASGDLAPDVTIKTSDEYPDGVLKPTMTVVRGEFREQMAETPLARIEGDALDSFGTPHDYPSSHAAFITKTDVIAYAYSPISDTGVLLARVRITDGRAKLIWKTFVQPLGIDHSKYRHDADVAIGSGRLVVTSEGAETIIESRDLESGDLIQRDVSATE